MCRIFLSLFWLIYLTIFGLMLWGLVAFIQQRSFGGIGVLGFFIFIMVSAVFLQFKDYFRRDKEGVR